MPIRKCPSTAAAADHGAQARACLLLAAMIAMVVLTLGSAFVHWPVSIAP